MDGNIFVPQIHDIIIPGMTNATSQKRSTPMPKIDRSFLALKPEKRPASKPTAKCLNEATMRFERLAKK